MTVIFSNERVMNDSSYRVTPCVLRRREGVEGGKKACVSSFSSFFFFSPSQKSRDDHPRDVAGNKEKESRWRRVPLDLPDDPPPSSHSTGPHCTVLRSSRGWEVQPSLKGTCDKCLYSFARTLATYHDRDESRILRGKHSSACRC